jgi:NitT/TauT family transport system ATP-binding protein
MSARPRQPSASAPLVVLESVEKTFTSRQGTAYTAVRDFNLELEAGEFFCLLGTSGCGKTTILNMVAGFETPTAGVIELEGKPVKGPGRDRSVVFQGDDSLYEWLTALENVEFGLRLRGVPKKARREQARHYLDLVGLGGQDGKHPSELSGGMKQRIQIARVLANEPKMLLMDEPFAALDAQTRSVMQEELAKIWQATATSVLFITHDIDEAISLATRIGVMYAGPASRLKQLVDVDLRGTRNRTDDRFLGYYRQIYAMIREEVDVARRRGADGAP